MQLEISELVRSAAGGRPLAEAPRRGPAATPAADKIRAFVADPSRLLPTSVAAMALVLKTAASGIVKGERSIENALAAQYAKAGSEVTPADGLEACRRMLSPDVLARCDTEPRLIAALNESLAAAVRGRLEREKHIRVREGRSIAGEPEWREFVGRLKSIGKMAKGNGQ